MTKLKNNELCIFVILLMASFAISFIIMPYVTFLNVHSIISEIPNLIGIMLSGVLAIIAIIFGLINPREFRTLSETYKEPDIEKNYNEHIEIMKFDTIILLLFFCISIALTYFINTSIGSLNFSVWTIFSLGIFSLVISIWVLHDIIISLFLLNQLRGYSPK